MNSQDPLISQSVQAAELVTIERDSFRCLGLGFALLLLCMTWQLLGYVSELEYSLKGIESGEWWRLLTAHFVHENWHHFAWNMSAWVLLVFLFGRAFNDFEWALAIIVIATSTSVMLYLWNPELERALGFSAVLHGVVVIGALGTWRRDRLLATAALVGLLLKLSWEQMVGPVSMLDDLHLNYEHRISVEAHLYGALSALILFGIGFYVRQNVTEQNARDQSPA